MTLKASATLPTTDRDWQRWLLESYDLRLRFGAGSPEGVVIADRGTLYCRTDGGVGTTLYAKSANDGLNTGWSAVT